VTQNPTEDTYQPNIK